jgi:hypothetical protein
MAEKFVKISKNGETIEVSPLVVDDHKRLGWTVAEPAKEPEKEPARKPEKEPVAK